MDDPPTPSGRPHATVEPFGRLRDGRSVEIISLHDPSGLTVRVLTYGAIVQSIRAPDRRGAFDDVVLGHPMLRAYETDTHYLGATVGRYANRIAGGRFVLDGRCHRLTRNDGTNTLHGGTTGFGRQTWTLASLSNDPVASATLCMTSHDGEDGFPGTLSVMARFSVAGDTFNISYHATTDAATVVSLTSHSYFNLAGRGSGRTALDHHLRLVAAAYLPVDDALIPTGERRDVTGTPFDFRQGRSIGRGYDHAFVLPGAETPATRAVAELVDPPSGRAMLLSTNQPCVQLYTGDHLDGLGRRPGAPESDRHAGVALEPQRFPDGPNQPALGPVRLEPGDAYRHETSYRFFSV